MTAFLFDSTSNQVINPTISPSTKYDVEKQIIILRHGQTKQSLFIKTSSSTEHKNGAIIGASVLLLNVCLCPLTDLPPPGWRGE